MQYSLAGHLTHRAINKARAAALEKTRGSSVAVLAQANTLLAAPVIPAVHPFTGVALGAGLVVRRGAQALRGAVRSVPHHREAAWGADDHAGHVP